MLRKLTIFCVALSLGMVSIGIDAVQALDRKDQPITLSLSNPKSRQEFPPMIAADPEFVLVRPDRCRLVPSCDTIPLVIDVPDNIIYRITSTTRFEHAGGANDIDIFYWIEIQYIKVKEDGSEEVTAPQYFDIASSATAGQPEVAKMADLPPSERRFEITTTEEDKNNGVQKTFIIFRYWITPVNWSGASLYSIEAELFEQTITRRERFVPNRRTFTNPSPPIRFTPKPSPSPSPEISPVAIPGDTGPLVEHNLVAVKGQAAGPEKQGPSATLIIGTVALLLLGSGLFLFFFMRARRKAA